jgi:hypothetical protein
MNIPELSIVIIVVLLLLVSFVFFRYSLLKLKSKIELTKKGALKNKQIDRLDRRMKKLGKFKFYCFYGIIIWGFFISIIINTLNFLDDKFIDKEEVVISDYFLSFTIHFLLFSIVGLFYARTVWKSWHE